MTTMELLKVAGGLEPKILKPRPVKFLPTLIRFGKFEKITVLMTKT